MQAGGDPTIPEATGWRSTTRSSTRPATTSRRTAVHGADAADQPGYGPAGGVRQQRRPYHRVRPGPGFGDGGQHQQRAVLLQRRCWAQPICRTASTPRRSYTDTAQLITGLPGTPFTNTSFDISAMGDGAGNQGYVDEIKVILLTTPILPRSCRPVRAAAEVQLGGNFVDQGTVALANRIRPRSSAQAGCSTATPSTSPSVLKA